MEVAFLVVVFLGVVGFVGWPLLRPSEYSVDIDELVRKQTELKEEKERLLTEIKDLELTHETGKISTADFSQMSSSAKRKAAAVLKELDEVEYNLASGKKGKKRKPKKAKKQAITACPTCGKKVDSADAFCRKCGASLQQS